MDERRTGGRETGLTKGLEKWKKKLTRENMAVVALFGLLIMVIAIPTGGRREENAEEPLPEETFSEQQEPGAGTAGAGSGTEWEAGYAKEMEKKFRYIFNCIDYMDCSLFTRCNFCIKYKECNVN